MNPLRRKILLVTAALTLALGLGAWLRFSQDPRTRALREIQARLLEVATITSFKEQDPPFVKLGYAGKLSEYFADTIELDITLGARSAHETISRAQLKDGAASLRATNRGLQVEFIDIVVDVTPPDPRASVHLTSKIYFLGDPDYFVQEFRIDLEKPADTWLVRRIATVRTME